MQNDWPSCRTNVRELPVIWLGHRHRAKLWGLGGSHAVNVYVRLVSFPLSGVRNDLASYKDPSPDTASFRAVAARVHRNCREIIPPRLCQLPQGFLQFGEPVDFRYRALQRPHCSSDVFEEMFMTLDQTEKSVST